MREGKGERERSAAKDSQVLLGISAKGFESGFSKDRIAISNPMDSFTLSQSHRIKGSIYAKCVCKPDLFSIEPVQL